MTKYIVLLRGVTPTGKNRVPMAQLRQLLAESGFQNVQTWIQSGNVILYSELSVEEVVKRVNKIIKESIGADLKIIVKTPAEIETVIAENPFGKRYDISRVFFTLFNDTPDINLVTALQAQDFGPDEFIFTPHAIYLFIPGSAAKTKLNNNFLERKLKIDTTTRNFNTLSKLIALSSNP
ncbi:hypothetical protein SDC9_79836 [bioreactor metagenome]|mgnify:FL=1|uniref:DUF1697 domain-containing protein n=1 Tax=bioreactor metagenome TaxID=1076179 RepID=A0A644YXJ4_9ZZZZ|nr:DUF1697 domain-containing protein [Petrimonas sp.]NLU29931.1 DUF1697 domain-containing protein [Bacteroidales bacterium]HBC38113.1 hypothetical protein [Porphyromonadaceae bacterium]MDD4845236.1 DUF1697 domain-containing protein [Petrimonas sp.]MDX9776056.1 DUF1697 domain-containing protein [Petrimonas sp.]